MSKVCKFGYQCHRADCWFSHPEGRQVDGAAGPAQHSSQQPQQQQYVINNNAQNFKQPEYHGGGGGGGGYPPQQQRYQYNAPMHGMAPHQMPPSNSQVASSQNAAYRSVTRPLTPHSNGAAASSASSGPAVTGNSVALLPGGAKLCKFGRECHRKDCYFAHPDGRDIEDSPHSSSASTPKMKSKKRDAVSPDGFDDDDDDDGGELDDNAVEALVQAREWFPAYKDCSCCKGYIHDCDDTMCQALGKCQCAQNKDETDAQADETWKDEFFGASRGCKCCEGFVYRCKNSDPLCKSSGKCFCQTKPAATASTASAAAPAPAPVATASAAGAAAPKAVTSAPGGPPL